jgi:hypothetical protein
MYSYKFINVTHSIWTGKPEERIEDIIEDYAAQGWRLVQVLRETNTSGKKNSKIILERVVPDDFYISPPTSPPTDAFNIDTDEFV